MHFIKTGLLGLMLLSGCSPQRMAGQGAAGPDGSCDAIGLTPGTPAYEQCRQDVRIRALVAQRLLFNPNNNQPAGMLVQQYNRPMSPLLNCTSYSIPIDGAPTLCN